ncbi:helix-turn-helix domain-containing protein [Actinomadura flavalba]|uniref:helix-turn-helix domain-containing protein n=1 Tax=Actinomadura flavalba TaxID=1120938 RepID=UPI00036FD912|nr:helix-turn-helix domain-containing protein [Actinomadura flavalba]
MSITVPESGAVEIARGGRRARFEAVVGGLHLDAVEVRQAGGAGGVHLRLSPPGVRALLGVPAAELAGEAAELGDVAPALRDLPERLAACGTWTERRALVEGLLLDGLDGRACRTPGGAALAVLAEHGRVQDAARTLGCSRRHLGDVVRSEFGVTPKHYLRLVRFERARARVAAAARAGRPGLAGVAAASGFADQAHLAREWRAMAGCTLTEWLRTESPAPPFPNLQDQPDRALR